MSKELFMSEMLINALRIDGYVPKCSYCEVGRQIEPAILLHNTDGTYQVRSQAGYGKIWVVVMEAQL